MLQRNSKRWSSCALWGLMFLWIGAGLPAWAQSAGQIRLSTGADRVYENAGSITIQAIREGGSAGPASVQFATFNERALAGQDYTAASGTLNWDPGEDGPKAIVIPILDDVLIEGDESFRLRLSNATGSLLGGPSECVVTILELEGGVFRFSADSTATNRYGAGTGYTVSERDGILDGGGAALYNQFSHTGAVVTVTRHNGVRGRVLIDYETQNGTAVAGQHYQPVSGTLVFEDYQVSANILVPLIDNADPAVPRAFNVIIRNPRPAPGENPRVQPALNGGGAQWATTVNILSEEPVPPDPARAVFNFTRAFTRVQEHAPNPPGQNRVRLFVGNFGNAAGSVTIRTDANNQFRANPGSEYANPNEDYVPTTITYQNVLPGVIVTIDIPIVDDNRVEFNEDFIVVATSGGDIATAVVTILSDDQMGGEQPAGAVDRTYNPDFLPTTTPPNNPAPGANDVVFALAVQSDNKTLIGGEFTSVNTVLRERIARLNLDGTVDSSFDPGLGANASVNAILVQPDGRILLGGGFTAFNGVQRYGVVRLQSDGTLDNSFNPGTGADNYVRAMGLYTNGTHAGKLVIGGDFINVNSTNINSVARLNPNGILDTSFNIGSGADGVVYAVAVQPDGKVLLGGDFVFFNGFFRSGVVRLNEDGSVDTSFFTGGGTDDVVYHILLQPDGKILIGGAFTSYDLRSRNRLARLNADGSLDTTFDPGYGADDTLFTIALQPDNKILIGGFFSQYNATRRVGLARLFPDGSLDTSFMDHGYNQFAGIPASSTTDQKPFVAALQLQSDGAVMIGGRFTRVGGGFSREDRRNRNHVARLMGGSTPGPGNLQFTSNQYSISEDAGRYFVTLTRVNGSLGVISAAFLTQDRLPGAGAALATNDYSFLRAFPQYNATWPLTRLRGDGMQGPNNLTTNLQGQNFLLPEDFEMDDIHLDIVDDSAVEGNENFNLLLDMPQGYIDLGGEYIPLGAALGKPEALATILDNDNAPGIFSFSQPGYSIDENGGNLTITVVRTDGSAGPVSVDYYTTNGTAVAGSDYSSRSGKLSFSSGQTTRSFTVPILDDALVENNETFLVVLHSPAGGAQIGVSNVVVTIVDNDFAPGRVQFSSATYASPEGSGSVAITVTRTGGSKGVLAVDYTISGGTATAGSDFVAGSGRLQWNDGETAPKTFQVTLINDVQVEGDETVQLALSNPSVTGALGTPSTALLTILEDDAFGTLHFSNSQFNVNEDSGAALITVVRTAGTAGSLTVNYATEDGTARAGQDYQSTSGTLTFGPGVVSQNISIPILDDPDEEGGNETFTVRLSNVTGGGLLGSPNPATVQILDNESVNVPAGSLDTTFAPGEGPDQAVYALAYQQDGKLLLAGDFTAINGITRHRIARLHPQGSLDGQFNSGAGANHSIRVIHQQPDGRILVGGLFTTMDGRNRNYIARLNIDGSLDLSFNPGSGADNPVYGIVQDSQGRILIAGDFSSFNGQSRRGIARLNSDGTLDSAFSIGTGAAGRVFSVALQTDGKILVGGQFETFNNVSRRNLVRLMPDGSVDASFVTGQGPNAPVRAMRIQSDGRILIGGSFTQVNGTGRNYLARLNSNGSLDTSFMNNVAGPSDSVYALALQEDGRIVLGGDFTQVNGVTRNRLAQMNSDGTIDPGINFGAGANAFIASVVIQPDRKIVVGGGFQTFNEVPRAFLARLHGGTIFGPGALEFSRPEFTVVEANTNAVVRVRRIGGTTGEVSVQYSTTAGTATAGADYQNVTGTLVFPHGETQQSFLIPIRNDVAIEEPETVLLQLSNPVTAGLGPQPVARLTILNDDAVLSFQSSSFSVNENAEPRHAVITVVRSGSTNGVVSVSYETVADTAEEIADFTVVRGTLVFQDGESMKTFTVPVADDLLIEGPETVNLRLFDPVGSAFLGISSAVLTIVDNDFGPGELFLSSAFYTADETDAQVYVTVVRSNGYTGLISLDYSTSDGTARSGLDYTGVSGSLAFADGETEKSFAIPILVDLLNEPNETVNIQIFNPRGGASLGSPATAILTIINNNEPYGRLVFSATQFTTGEGSGSAVVQVSRILGKTGVVTVNYSTANGTASAGSDYTATAGILTFGDGETNKTFLIPILEDEQVEGNETINLSLSSPTGGASLGIPSTATLVIQDNDSPRILPDTTSLTSESFSPPNSTVDPGERVTVQFGLRNAGFRNTASLVATLQAINGVSSPSASQNYGVLQVNGPSVSRPFTFTASGTNGQVIQVTFSLQDGPNNLGTVVFPIILGTVSRTFTSTRAIDILDNQAALPYPSTIAVSGMTGGISKVTVRLAGLTHPYPDDIDVMLVSPAGHKIILMSDAGGQEPVNNVNLVFDEAAAGVLPDAGQIVSGTYRPHNYVLADSFPAPAPGGPYETTFSVLTDASPNGTWSLYVSDDNLLDAGQISGGWSLTISVVSKVIPPAPARFETISFLQDGSASILLQGRPGRSYVIEGSMDSILWSPFGTNTTTDGMLNFIDTSSTNAPVKLYRAFERP